MPDNPLIPNFIEGDLEEFLGFEIPDLFGPSDGGGGSALVGASQTGTIPTARASNGVASGPGCPPVVVPVEVTRRAKVPRGYVVVVDPQTKQKVGMLKAVARHCKLWKPARKPPISASDWRCLQKANMTVKKLDRVVKMSNKVTGKASLTRSRRSR
jgi:hypothetical protein